MTTPSRSDRVVASSNVLVGERTMVSGWGWWAGGVLLSIPVLATMALAAGLTADERGLVWRRARAARPGRRPE